MRMIRGRQTTNEFVIETTADAFNVQYTFTCTGQITKGQMADADDVIRQNTDGTWTADAVAGGGGVDSWLFEGQMVSMTVTDNASGATGLENVTLLLNEKAFGPSDLPLPKQPDDGTNGGTNGGGSNGGTDGGGSNGGTNGGGSNGGTDQPSQAGVPLDRIVTAGALVGGGYAVWKILDGD